MGSIRACYVTAAMAAASYLSAGQRGSGSTYWRRFKPGSLHKNQIIRSQFHMKFTKAFFTLTMLAAGIASAASGYSITFTDPVWIGATQLKAGAYTVEMQGDKAIFKTSGKKVAEIPA